ncbi:septin-2-like isoform X1 [Apostichopus japonicus]|uniref:septin-2-like isoform X1 n=1 Tax=Stichopus japonicus TaxID=307972 RepID=UPI003AB2D823
MSSYRRYSSRLTESSSSSSATSSTTSSSSYISTSDVTRRTTTSSTNFSRSTPLRSTWATSRPALPPKPAKSLTELEKYDVSSTVTEEPARSKEYPTGSREFIGFATLPDQVHRKSVKKGFEFTLMVVGESGLGKSTLVNSLFLTELYKQRAVLNAEEKISQTVEIERSTQDIEEGGVRLKLTVVDTPGFGDAVNNTDSFTPIVTYVDDQFEQYFTDESGLNRKNIVDNRIHCCLYFISPFGHGLRPIDVEFMKRMHNKVNIIPVIGKSDCLTPTEIKKLKERILDEVDEYNINIYKFTDGDSDEDEDTRRENSDLQSSVPFAIIGSNTVVEVGGKRVRGRLYPWGIAEVENPKHSDFIKLRNMLIRTHMQDLKDVTQDVHYENFRLQKIKNGGKIEPVNGKPHADTDAKLKEKEDELKKMQEMILTMQRQMAMQQGKQQMNGTNNNILDDRGSSTIDM